MMTPERKKQIIGEFSRNDNDTGSAHIQVALLTERIKYLTEHLKTHKKDHSSRRGLLKLVGKRAKLLKYLDRKDHEHYLDIIKRLGIRKK